VSMSELINQLRFVCGLVPSNTSSSD